MFLKNVNLRPFNVGDVATFDQFRKSYWDGDLELPKGYGARGVETSIAEDETGRPIASLTGTMAVILDPLIRNPHIKSGKELVASIYALERTLSYQGQKSGAVDAYIAIPSHLTEYHRIVEKAGYVETVKNCKVFRRPLNPDTHQLIGPELELERQQIIAKMNEEKEVGRIEESAELDIAESLSENNN